MKLSSEANIKCYASQEFPLEVGGEIVMDDTSQCLAERALLTEYDNKLHTSVASRVSEEIPNVR